MTQPEPAIDSFQETFCAQYGVPPASYAIVVLRLTLYPHARWLADTGPEKLLAADRTFVASVGLLRRWRDFAAEAREFQYAPENRRFWRRRLRLRVSVHRMQVLFSEVMGGSVSHRRLEALGPEASGDPGTPATN
jgi:hypothetical protein